MIKVWIKIVVSSICWTRKVFDKFLNKSNLPTVSVHFWIYGSSEVLTMLDFKQGIKCANFSYSHWFGLLRNLKLRLFLERKSTPNHFYWEVDRDNLSSSKFWFIFIVRAVKIEYEIKVLIYTHWWNAKAYDIWTQPTNLVPINVQFRMTWRCKATHKRIIFTLIPPI